VPSTRKGPAASRGLLLRGRPVQAALPVAVGDAVPRPHRRAVVTEIAGPPASVYNHFHLPATGGNTCLVVRSLFSLNR
jgi:hypothetical protein